MDCSKFTPSPPSGKAGIWRKGGSVVHVVTIAMMTGPVFRVDNRRTRVEPPAAAFEVSLPIDSNSGRQTLQVSVRYYYCRTRAEGICKVGTVAWTVPVELSADAEGDAVVLKHQVQ
jgi:hypothetical protein